MGHLGGGGGGGGGTPGGIMGHLGTTWEDNGDELAPSLQEAMQTLSFTEEEQMFLFKVIAGVLHFGNIEVKQRPREEWATIPTAEGWSPPPLRLFASVAGRSQGRGNQGNP